MNRRELSRMLINSPTTKQNMEKNECYVATEMKRQLSSPLILRSHPLLMQDNFSLLSSILKLYWHSDQKLMHLSQSDFDLLHIILPHIWDQRTLGLLFPTNWGDGVSQIHLSMGWTLRTHSIPNFLDSQARNLGTPLYVFLIFLKSYWLYLKMFLQ